MLRGRKAAERAGRAAPDRPHLVGRPGGRPRQQRRHVVSHLPDDHQGAQEADSAYFTAFQAAGLDLRTSSPAEAGRWLAARSEPAELVSYLDDWAAQRRRIGRPGAESLPIVAAARAADPDPWRDALRPGPGRGRTRRSPNSAAWPTTRRL